MRVSRERPPRRGGPVLTALVCLLVTFGLAFGGALLWQTAQEAGNRAENPSRPASAAPPRAVSSSGGGSVASAGAGSGEGTSSARASQQEEESSGESSEAPPRVAAGAQNFAADLSLDEGADANFAGDRDAPPDGSITPGFEMEGQVSLSPQPVGNDYFDDAIFFGDSISTGITAYNIANNTACVAAIGVSPNTILTQGYIPDGNGELQTLLEAAKAHGERKKVYIMLGGNGLWQEKDAFISDYQRFIDAVRDRYPGATVYLQSMTPVTGFVEEKYPSVTPAKVREYNEAVAQLARQNNLPYVNVFEALCGPDGLLPDEVSPDGLHLSAEYYFKWFDYLRAHTVEETA